MRKFYASLLLLFGLGAFEESLAQTNSVTLTPPTGPTSNYSSITAAYAAIPNAPTGNYLIEINTIYDGSSETYPIVLGDKGLSGGNPTITIRPAAGNNGEIIQRATPAAGSVISLDGGDNIIVDGRPGGVSSVVSNYLMVNDLFSGSNSSRNIELWNGANNNIIRYINAVAAAPTATTGARVINISTSPLGQPNNNNVITNNVVTGGLRGIQVFGTAAINTGNVISNNVVRDFGDRGIFGGSFQDNTTIQSNTIGFSTFNPLGTAITGIDNQGTGLTQTNILDNVINLPLPSSTTVTQILGISDVSSGGVTNIERNTINNLSSPVATIIWGIYTTTQTAVQNINVRRNKIYDLSSNAAASIRGISFAGFTGSTFRIENNFVSLTQANSSATSVLGIFIGGTAATNTYTTHLYHNTFRIGGTLSSTSGTANSVVSAGIFRNNNQTGSSYNQINNIAINERSGGVTGVAHIGFINFSANGTLNVDHNTYFASAASDAYAAGWTTGTGTTVFASSPAGLTLYKTDAAPNEQNSNFANVLFVSNTDLHLAPPSDRDPALKGTPIGSVTVDIDGETRSATTPRQGADDSNLTFPVILFSFKGESKGDYNQLNWITSTEVGNAGFELQKSIDGKEFAKLAFINSKSENGNSSTSLNYTFDDRKPFNEVSYYRLKQVDINGRTSYSNIILIKGKGATKLEISNIYPNPAVNDLRIVVSNAKDSRAMVSITDISGKLLLTQSTGLKAGDNVLNINVSSLSSGNYVLTVRDQSTGEMISTRFVK
jgi:hypothetical protein